MALFADPVLMAAVAGGLLFLITLKVAAFIAVRRVLRAPARRGDGAPTRSEPPHH